MIKAFLKLSFAFSIFFSLFITENTRTHLLWKDTQCRLQNRFIHFHEIGWFKNQFQQPTKPIQFEIPILNQLGLSSKLMVFHSSFLSLTSSSLILQLLIHLNKHSYCSHLHNWFQVSLRQASVIWKCHKLCVCKTIACSHTLRFIFSDIWIWLWKKKMFQILHNLGAFLSVWQMKVESQ